MSIYSETIFETEQTYPSYRRKPVSRQLSRLPAGGDPGFHRDDGGRAGCPELVPANGRAVRNSVVRVLLRVVGLAIVATVVVARVAAAGDAGVPIKLSWTEGDVAGISSILSPTSDKPIGHVEYHQQRHGDVIEAVRIAHFNDGSSDEDHAEARVGETLRSLRGRSIIRNTKGVATSDITIDVAGGHISGFSGLGKDRVAYDEHVELPEGTYWGPLIFMVIKSFDANAVDNRLVFRTVIATPKPRVIDMELLKKNETTVRHAGTGIKAVQFVLRPTVNWLVDPIIRMFAPDTNFFVKAGEPPALVRFAGPRNFAGQKIRIE